MTPAVGFTPAPHATPVDAARIGHRGPAGPVLILGGRLGALEYPTLDALAADLAALLAGRGAVLVSGAGHWGDWSVAGFHVRTSGEWLAFVAQAGPIRSRALLEHALAGAQRAWRRPPLADAAARPPHPSLFNAA